ncbi:hypothetical protein DL93DRAFT_2233384 [Clavulina sp. PMI_390]|nr:hypothetical protein DL93DRAFT_2233384 [Clavulina sp. PMI_390]
MSVTQITSFKQFEELRESNKIVIIGFSTKRQPELSRELSRFLEKEAAYAKEAKKQFEFYKVAAEEQSEIMDHCRMEHLPGVIAFKKEIGRVDGPHFDEMTRMMDKIYNYDK